MWTQIGNEIPGGNVSGTKGGLKWTSGTLGQSVLARPPKLLPLGKQSCVLRVDLGDAGVDAVDDFVDAHAGERNHKRRAARRPRTTTEPLMGRGHRPDSNRGPKGYEPSALPGCATVTSDSISTGRPTVNVSFETSNSRVRSRPFFFPEQLR